MLITCPPRQPFKNGPRSARAATPTPTRTQGRERATASRGRPRRDSGRHGGRYSARAGASLAPTGRGLERFSRHVFRGEMAGLRG